ncbi:MAG TPA: TIGR00730 family Rossman fold protein, partial [Hanamia sp.]|nr:TIGR00730 family Rossman fold protein [Hanamia sp.]
MSIQSLAVFCGSKNGNDPLFCMHAKQVGNLLGEKNINLIYGGGNKGMMGTIANAVLEKGGKVIGIMPRFLAVPEHQHHGLTEMLEVEDMHIRKRMMYEKCDAALVLPGGFGTMDEFFEMLTWNQLNIHNKKI